MLLCPPNTVLNAGSDTENVPLFRCGPANLGGFIGGCDFFGRSPKAPNEVVVKVEGFGFARGNAVHIDPCEKGPASAVQFHSGFLAGFTRGCICKPRVVRLDVTAREEPAF